MPRFEGIKYFSDNDPALLDNFQAISKVLQWCEGHRQLDVGSGNITLSPETKRADIAEYPGLDFCCDAASLRDRNGISLPDRSFDFIYSSHCLEHTNDPLVTLREWCRVAQKFVAVIIPNGLMFKNVSQEEMNRLGHKHNIYIEDVWNMSQQLNDIVLLQELGYTSVGRENIYFVLVKKIWG
ncbi:MAG: class I SAM-dependent methyltransferase [Proteobacteria bacterium]|nr:class I SAM-dependent methyltransferase [Pseudomonadota bacterium]